jgi:pimeloyl-[acyl-carrier protein] methyl ester esterase
MTPSPLFVLLPGLHGTAELFDPFIAAAPKEPVFRVLQLPPDGPQDYQTLADRIIPQLPAGPVLLVAESFSGPLAIRVAQKAANVIGSVICASFVAPPLPSVLKNFASLVVRFVPPVPLLRLLMTGGDQSAAVAVRAAIRAADAGTLVGRIEAALGSDASEVLSQLQQPILFLRARNDRLVPLINAARIRSLNPSVEVVDIDGPHLLLQTRPAEVWRQIVEFVDGIGAARST